MKQVSGDRLAGCLCVQAASGCGCYCCEELRVHLCESLSCCAACGLTGAVHAAVIDICQLAIDVSFDHAKHQLIHTRVIRVTYGYGVVAVSLARECQNYTFLLSDLPPLRAVEEDAVGLAVACVYEYNGSLVTFYLSGSGNIDHELSGICYAVAVLCIIRKCCDTGVHGSAGLRNDCALQISNTSLRVSITWPSFAAS